MFFSVGVESPQDVDTAFGITVPAFDRFDYGCVSAADEQKDIPVMAREAILSIVEEMLISGAHSVEDITDAGYRVYAANPEYAHCDSWFMIDVDLTGLEGKQQRLNITLPDVLVKRLDGFIQDKRAIYKDRSHFLAQAARHELANK
ncbi:type II toxin-antitoxin system HicB family antitoxin [Vagococcus sp. WN89Y]|uniref:type II toxin-antitoxin system HicB family antitoxin n=1 Tax=Vagococcus sp. WN89Y TaxID=3457258 RepID=UPI003FCE37A3